MALGLRPGADPLDLYGERFCTALIGQDRKDRMQRPHPAQRARAPAHRLGPWKVLDRAGDHLGGNLGRRAARARDLGEPDLTLFIGARGQLIAGKPG